eukprot:TRINITY_DN1604_c0_g1_i1.p1 TRINITY_DN1604_c0_g1~~TRINITY_DN1604_c0_g1_i1.p1  ORF type:complete len:377 (-),score=52.85 TRINITY_DN1604_c0_g1_i1:27-1073(-)
MKSQLFVILTLTYIVSTLAEKPIICNQTGAHTDEELNQLLQAINDQTMSDEKVKVVAHAVSVSQKGFTGPQVVKLLKLFGFSKNMKDVVELINMHVLSITAEECADILETFSFSSDKLKVLEQIANFVSDLQINNETIVNGFTMSSDKQKARDIIANASPRSCIYGTVTEKRVHFIVDVSLSMTATFIATNGEKFNRLSFVQKELDEVIRYQLKSDQNMNVFSFAGRVIEWQPGLVPANQTMINSAVSFVDRMDFRKDGTNSYEALRVALSEPELEAVYFLTDGQPSVGPSTDSDYIVKKVLEWNVNGIPVHSTAFLSGQHSSDYKPEAKRFMEMLADATGGIYRCIE